MGVYTLRPYTYSGDWIDAGGGSLADESDTSYKYFTNLYQYGTAVVATTAIPWSLNLVIKSIKIRVRGERVGTPQYLQVTAFTSLGRVLISQGDGYQVLISDTTWSVVSTGQRVISLLQSEGDISVVLHPVGGDPFVSVPKVSELYVDLEFVYPPIATVNNPTGTYTTTSAPPFQFNFFSQDGYTQSAYRYLIYTAAQVAATGFIPGTTTPDYDSGIIFSTGNTGTLFPRVNGTYRVYFAAAQTVNGSLQWSLWDSGTGASWNDYTLNITPPAAPTLAVAADNTNAKIDVTITGAGAANSVLDVYQLERSSDSGVTWDPVRGDSSTGYIESIGGVRIWRDYETANGENVVYRARTITADTVGNTLVGAYSSNSASVGWSSSSTWLKVVTDPSLNRVVIIRSFGDERYDVPLGTFQGLDSDEVVTVSGRRRGTPDASFKVLAQTVAEQQAIRNILALGLPILVHASSRSSGWGGVSKYLQVGDLIVSRPTRAGWSHLRDLTMPYTEVARPDVHVYLFGLGTNTWQDLDDAYASFTALNAAFATYGAIRG